MYLLTPSSNNSVCTLESLLNLSCVYDKVDIKVPLSVSSVIQSTSECLKHKKISSFNIHYNVHFPRNETGTLQNKQSNVGSWSNRETETYKEFSFFASLKA